MIIAEDIVLGGFVVEVLFAPAIVECENNDLVELERFGVTIDVVFDALLDVSWDVVFDTTV